jgi:hypothetical protein
MDRIENETNYGGLDRRKDGLISLLDNGTDRTGNKENMEVHRHTDEYTGRSQGDPVSLL